MTRVTRAIAMLLLAGLIAACGEAARSPSDGSPSATRTPNESAAAGKTAPVESDGETEPPAESGEPTEEPTESASAGASPASDDPFVGRTVVSLVNRLRLRAAAGTEAVSLRTLPRGSALFVLGGPSQASGFSWYQVVPLTEGEEGAMVGWVASASANGASWLEAAEATCPAAPETFEELVALSPGERLACFSQTPISVTARLAPCDCDFDPAEFDPEWFGVTEDDGAPVLLADPATEGRVKLEQGVVLVVDPAGTTEDPVPVGQVVEVTGVFDHPAAASCTRSVDGGEPEPDVSCRFEFAVTSLQVAAP